MRTIWSLFEYHFSCDGLNFTKVNLLGVFDNIEQAQEIALEKREKALQTFHNITIDEDGNQCTIKGKDMLYQLFIIESPQNQKISIEIIDEE